MNFTNLDLDTLRTLAVASDLGGYGQAGARLGRTPSAISLQMKRLQQDVGARLFRKQGRGVALTEAGELVLGYARRMLALNDELLDTVRGAALVGSVRLGFSQDFADVILPVVLARFTALYPLVMVEVRIEGNAALVEAVAKDQLDLALAVGHADRVTAESVGALDLVWIAGERFVSRPDQALPLVLLRPRCAFRKEAIRSLDAAGISWRVAAVSPSIAGVWAAAIGGLGVTMHSALGVPQALSYGKAMFDLPPLGEFPVTLHARTGKRSDAVERLRAIVREAVREGLRRQGSGTGVHPNTLHRRGAHPAPRAVGTRADDGPRAPGAR
ncbi:MAG TPA: LysR substrate-binding domain-containing protein [Gemmatimonadaceae bacterium]